MMPLNRRDFIHVGLLLLCVPTQYLMNRYFGNGDEIQRTNSLKKMFVGLSDLKHFIFHWDSWPKWGIAMISLLRKRSFLSLFDDDDGNSTGECPAKEVINYLGANAGYFANSAVIRSPRPENVKYRIGQVIIHKEWGFRGIIIGWDLIAKAPESWLHRMHPSDKQHWRMIPNYTVLVDERDRKGHQRVYVPQESIIVLKSTRVFHGALEDYFDDYDGSQYLPRQALRKLYPHD